MLSVCVMRWKIIIVSNCKVEFSITLSHITPHLWIYNFVYWECLHDWYSSKNQKCLCITYITYICYCNSPTSSVRSLNHVRAEVIIALTSLACVQLFDSIFCTQLSPSILYLVLIAILCVLVFFCFV